MRDEEYKDLVTKHDKHIDIMATSIEHLASAVGTTNRKLEDIISVISAQNVLMEKVTNLESNLKESFSRVHTKIKDLEIAQSSTGCVPAQRNADKVEVANKRIKDIEDAIKWVVRILVGAVLLAVLGLVMQTGG